MKKIVNLVAFIGLIAALVTYSSCGPTPTAELPLTDQQLQKLLNTTSTGGGTEVKADWTCTSATLDGVDKTANYTAAFTLTLSGTIGATTTGTSPTFGYKTTKPTFVTSESPISPWAISGTFKFDDTAPATKVTRDDQTAVQYSVSDTQLTISFTFAPTSNSTYDRKDGRIDVVKGAWIFNFKKKI